MPNFKDKEFSATLNFISKLLTLAKKSLPSLVSWEILIQSMMATAARMITNKINVTPKDA